MNEDNLNMARDARPDAATKMTGLRRGAWIGAAALLTIVLVTQQFTDEVDWSPADFIIAGILLFGSLGAYEIVVRISHDVAYRLGAGLAIAAAVILIWVNGAVGISDTDADMIFSSVLIIGVVGAFMARFQAAGMARAMWATAIALALTGVGVVVAGIVPEFNTPFEILAITTFFVVLFSGSARLFQQAAKSDRPD